MTIASIIEDVQVETAMFGSAQLRVIEGAVRRAILSCHAVARFNRDIADYNIPGFASDSSGKFQAALPPRFRKEHQVKAFYADGSVLTNFTIVDEENLSDHFGFALPNPVLFLGNTVTINYCGQPTALHLRYFSFPEINMNDQTTTSWIVESYDTPIVHKAAYSVFAASGDQEGREWQRNLYEEAKFELLQNYPTAD